MPWPFTADDTTGDDEREYLNDNCKEGVDPRSVWDDWGDREVDHKVEETEDDVHCSTEDEVETYYNETRPSGWWPL